MHKVTKQMRTETAHRLMEYNGLCAHNHGHSYLWEITATTYSLTDNGMVIDFKDLKVAMESVLEPLDHASVYRTDDPLGVSVAERFTATNGEQQRVFRFPWNPTAENFAKYAFDEIQKALDAVSLPSNQTKVKLVNVRVWETATSFADYGGAFLADSI